MQKPISASRRITSAFCLFPSNFGSWRNAVDLRHTPVSRSALVSTEARPARPVGIPNWPAVPQLDRAKVGPRGRTRTRTVEGLSFAPLRWATGTAYALALRRARAALISAVGLPS